MKRIWIDSETTMMMIMLLVTRLMRCYTVSYEAIPVCLLSTSFFNAMVSR